MLKRKFSSALMIQNDLSDSLRLPPARHHHDRNRNLLTPGSIDHDETLHGTLLEEPRVLFNQVRLVAMARNQVEVAFLE